MPPHEPLVSYLKMLLATEVGAGSKGRQAIQGGKYFNSLLSELRLPEIAT